MRAMRFPSGQVVMTRGVEEALAGRLNLLLDLLRRHLAGDWGEVGPGDWAANEEALRAGDRLLSAYTLDSTRVWLITEGDRSSTCALLPEEY